MPRILPDKDIHLICSARNDKERQHAVDIFKKAKSKGVDVSSLKDHHEEPLAIALTRLKRFKTLKLLTPHGLNLHASDTLQNNLLHIAALHQWVEMVEFLISHNVNVHQNNAIGHQPLACSVSAAFSETQTQTDDCIKILDLLLKAGADINHRSDDYPHRYCTALDWAIRKGNLTALSFLIQQPGIELLDVNGQGDSLLALSMNNSSFEVFKCILEQPSFSLEFIHRLLNQKDRRGLTPTEQAQQQELQEHLLYLQGPGLSLLERYELERTTPHRSSQTTHKVCSPMHQDAIMTDINEPSLASQASGRPSSKPPRSI